MIINKQFINSNLIKNKNQKIILIKSTQGSGKSIMFRSYILETKSQFIFIASRISLIVVDQKEKFDTCKLKINSKLYNEKSKKKFKQNDNLFICINSLLKLDKITFTNYVIFFDEIQSVIETLLFSSNIENSKRVKIFEILIKIFNNSKLIIGVESEISEATINFIKDYVGKDILIITNEFKKYKNIKVKFNHKIIKKIQSSEKYIVATDTKNNALKLFNYFNDKEIRLIVGSNDKNHKNICFNLDNYNKIIYSPKITHGVDSSMGRPVFAVYTGLTINSKSMAQQLTRCRNIEEVNIYYKTIKDGYFINKINDENQYSKMNTLLIYLKMN